MCRVLFSIGVISGVLWAGIVSASAAPGLAMGMSALKNQVTPVQKVTFWRHYYRRYGYPVPAPYPYYPPAAYYPSQGWGYYPPPYGYYSSYPPYAPYAYRQPYYSPY